MNIGIEDVMRFYESSLETFRSNGNNMSDKISLGQVGIDENSLEKDTIKSDLDESKVDREEIEKYQQQRDYFVKLMNDQKYIADYLDARGGEGDTSAEIQNKCDTPFVKEVINSLDRYDMINSNDYACIGITEGLTRDYADKHLSDSDKKMANDLITKMSDILIKRASNRMDKGVLTLDDKDNQEYSDYYNKVIMPNRWKQKIEGQIKWAEDKMKE